MNTEDAKTEETSSITSGGFLPFKKRMSHLNNPPNSALEVALPGKVKYKGVVQQQNGHWGAQIYADHRRIWLGTFRSAAEAAAAYDSASIKIRTYDANTHRNFPWSEYTIHEPAFQNEHTTEGVLSMIKDGTYQRRYSEFSKKIQSKIAKRCNVVGSKEDQESSKRFSCTELFRKELTPSDVGKLNRLVIPKKYAVKYLPFIRDDRDDEREEGGIGEDVEVVFYDRAMRQWKFRYCYWRSSQSFVLTRGWIGFVKEKSLQEKDVIVFYTCKTLEGGQSKNFLMIDVHCSSDDGSAVRDDEEGNETVRNSSEGEVKTEGEEETKSVENKEGFMLFGVRIQ
ncbi:AP2/ERF and B3 domain-containing transcription factor [Raphanus sativus]|uniref:AP2/ERF and B3 domain-containing transcription factor At1g51120-like n=1 Tax=Raphanus sativus TaxID=3726 RepID=A0A6J0NSM5_RAPSA|nr:AP2/ERF and B3 domain-containing transcription factor At1g51120-like [Raphanus sativus]KAJ4917698.1 AP2/ERF and B3 domain-containing transcription factor [Raphanus sativus]